jgi:hypothetical protein
MAALSCISLSGGNRKVCICDFDLTVLSSLRVVPVSPEKLLVESSLELVESPLESPRVVITFAGSGVRSWFGFDHLDLIILIVLRRSCPNNAR